MTAVRQVAGKNYPDPWFQRVWGIERLQGKLTSTYRRALTTLLHNAAIYNRSYDAVATKHLTHARYLCTKCQSDKRCATLSNLEKTEHRCGPTLNTRLSSEGSFKEQNRRNCCGGDQLVHRNKNWRSPRLYRRQER